MYFTDDSVVTNAQKQRKNIFQARNFTRTLTNRLSLNWLPIVWLIRLDRRAQKKSMCCYVKRIFAAHTSYLEYEKKKIKIVVKIYHCCCSSWIDFFLMKIEVYNVLDGRSVLRQSKRVREKRWLTHMRKRERGDCCWDECVFVCCKLPVYICVNVRPQNFTLLYSFVCHCFSLFFFWLRRFNFCSADSILFNEFLNVLRFSVVIFVRHHQQNTVFHTQSAHKFLIWFFCFCFCYHTNVSRHCLRFTLNLEKRIKSHGYFSWNKKMKWFFFSNGFCLNVHSNCMTMFASIFELNWLKPINVFVCLTGLYWKYFNVHRHASDRLFLLFEFKRIYRKNDKRNWNKIDKHCVCHLDGLYTYTTKLIDEKYVRAENDVVFLYQ